MSQPTNRELSNGLPKWVWAVLFALALPTFLLGLNMALIGPDEPRYAQVGREMWQSGDWTTPTLAGHHWFEKPPLLYWLQASFYSVFGVTEFAARLGSALFGLGTVACLWLVGRTVVRDDRSFANWLAVIAASTLGLIAFSHGATTDVIVTLPLTIAMCAFLVFDRRAADGARGLFAPLAAMYAAAGVALLAKGLIGAIFPPAIVAFYYLLSRRMPSRQLILSSLWGIPVSLAVAAVWYVPMYMRHGDEFIREFILRQHFERFTSNTFQHPQAWYFYIEILPLMVLPWLPLVVYGIWKAVRRIQEDPRDTTNPVKPVLIFSFSWLVVPLIFFSMSGSKLPGYILPAIPPAIILAGVAVWRIGQRNARSGRLLAGLAGLTMLVVSILLAVVLPGQMEEHSTRGLFRAAESRGLAGREVLLMHSYFHNAEFYAGDRLMRDADGKQVRLFGSKEVVAEMHRLGDLPVLVLVPKEYIYQLTGDPELNVEVLGQNREEAIVSASFK